MKNSIPRTKIICTIGPSSESAEVLREMVAAGMSVARLNFSHGTLEEHREKIRKIRQVSAELDRPVAILQDLRGPKIRVGAIPEPGVELRPGQPFSLTTESVAGDSSRVSVTYANLPAEVAAGDRILLADGLMELVVDSISGTEIRCSVVTGGTLTSHKGINLPSGSLQVAAITEKDLEDLRFGLANDVDYVALSFVRSPEDILLLKRHIKEAGKNVPVIAKVEKHEALDHIEEIVEAADAVMVARGDLGVEIPLQRVPGIQKQIVRRANAAGKPVIIATQMLRSMVDAPRPTRAEAGDVANAVLDGADAVMLSEETANGRYPVAAVRYMALIAEEAETDFPHKKYLQMLSKTEPAEAVAYAACVVALQIGAAAIIATSRSGFTALQIARFKPKPALLALSPEEATARRLALCWGCTPRTVSEDRDTDQRLETAAEAALASGVAKKGDWVVITAGHPVWATGTTNMLKVWQL
ncbi:MAG: pyruvate kinase [Desulfobacterales bacterium]|nr:pyruvate kinase [Desulfobacterales bacterium]